MSYLTQNCPYCRADSIHLYQETSGDGQTRVICAKCKKAGPWRATWQQAHESWKDEHKKAVSEYWGIACAADNLAGSFKIAYMGLNDWRKRMDEAYKDLKNAMEFFEEKIKAKEEHDRIELARTS